MAEIRHCDQCGRVFEPRREHARFCSGTCRVAWNRAHRRDPATEVHALDWSVAALADLPPRLSSADGNHVVAIVSEAVWQVTIVDATLVRYYPDVYDEVLDLRPRQQRRLIEGSMAGLRFVRNRMRCEAEREAFVGPPPGVPAGAVSRADAFTWQMVPEPLADVPRSARRTWELTRYQAYRAFLAGHPVGETFGRATEFLRQAATGATTLHPAGPKRATGR